MVLLVMYRVSKRSTKKIPYEELVLQAWRDYPEAFSLRNYPEYPDASDIHKKLYGGLKTDGLVLSLGDKNFRLTEKGIQKAAELIAVVEGQSHVTTDVIRPAKDEERFIDHAIRSRPYKVWTANGREQLTDYDARVLFQFSTGTRISDRVLKVDFAKEATRKAKALGVSGAEELEALINYLVEHFNALFKEKM